MEIKRDKYLNQFIKKREDGMIKIINGILVLGIIGFLLDESSIEK